MTQPEQYIDKSTDASEFELADPPPALKRYRRG